MVNVPVEDVIVRPFMLVAVATPKVGVVRDGEVARTALPLPVVATLLKTPPEVVVTTPAVVRPERVIVPAEAKLVKPEIDPPVIATAEAA